jgi:hypothetical protein
MENQECWKGDGAYSWTLTKMLGSESRDEKSRFLPIIFNIRKAKITDAYHKILGLTRIGDNMAVSLIPVFQYETLFPQFLADINTERTGTKVLITKRR